MNLRRKWCKIERSLTKAQLEEFNHILVLGLSDEKAIRKFKELTGKDISEKTIATHRLSCLGFKREKEKRKEEEKEEKKEREIDVLRKELGIPEEGPRPSTFDFKEHSGISDKEAMDYMSIQNEMSRSKEEIERLRLEYLRSLKEKKGKSKWKSGT